MTGSMSRRAVLGLASTAVLGVAACGAPGAPQSGGASSSKPVVTKPKSPVALSLLDGSGDLTYNQVIYDAFAKAHPELVSGISYQSAAAPDVAGKVKAQQLADKVDISGVLGGTDILGAAQQQDLMVALLPAFSSSLPDLSELQDAPRAAMQALAKGVGVLNNYTPSGPILMYHSTTMPTPPKTPADLLAWAKANPGKFSYAQPPNSGPGRTFMMSLPYMLKDSDPKDPEKGWTKTWAYLQQLGKYVSSYPASSTIMNNQFASGQFDLVPGIVSMDVINHHTGVFPATDEPTLFTDQHWVTDAHYIMVPKGVSPEVLYVMLELITFDLRPESQAMTFVNGSVTPAISGVDVSKASPEGQQVYAQFARPDYYPKAFTTGKTHTPLTPLDQVKAFDLWQRNVGSRVGS